MVLPWFDRSLAGAALDVMHPQAALHALLAGMGATADEAEAWPGASDVPHSREALLAGALLPADRVRSWQHAPPPPPGGLHRLSAADQQEEAAAIALLLRDAIEQPGRRAALVTPDRGLAVRVAAELLRWGVVADDSAGEPLADTPPAVFLRLLARAAAEDLAPVPLLSLLKHPLAAAACRPRPAGRRRARWSGWRCAARARRPVSRACAARSTAAPIRRRPT